MLLVKVVRSIATNNASANQNTALLVVYVGSNDMTRRMLHPNVVFVWSRLFAEAMIDRNEHFAKNTKLECDQIEHALHFACGSHCLLQSHFRAGGIRAREVI